MFRINPRVTPPTFLFPAYAALGIPPQIETSSSLISAILSERNSDPSAPSLHRLVKKWDELMGQFTHGDRALSSSLTAVYSDASNVSMLEQALPGIGEAANIIAAAQRNAK